MSGLPTSWADIELSVVAQVTSGIGFPNEYQGHTSGDLPFFKVSDISHAVLANRGELKTANHYVSHEVAEKLKGKPLAPGSTVFAKIGEAVRLNRRATVTTPCLIDNNVMAVKARDGVDDRYVHQFLRTIDFGESARSTTVPSLRKGDVEELRFPLAPAAEQKRIADKLDTVLTRVDAVNTRLARVAPLLKRFRQSVLAAATSGRLTEDWRKTKAGAVALEYQSIELTIPYAHAITAPKVWTAMRFDEAIDLVGGSQPPKAVFSDVEQDGYVRLIQIRDYKSDKYKTHIPRELARRFCSSSDVMIGRYGPPIFQILRGLEGAYNVALMKAVPRQDIYSNDYLFYFLQKPDLLRYVEAGSDRTAGQDGVNKDHLIKYPVFAPPIEEQTEIVRRVETLFAFADRLEARLAQAQTAATRLTPALLAKAFRGELVPQDPNDEPAAELLRRLQAQRATGAPASKTGAGRGRGRKAAASAAADL